MRVGQVAGTVRGSLDRIVQVGAEVDDGGGALAGEAQVDQAVGILPAVGPLCVAEAYLQAFDMVAAAVEGLDEPAVGVTGEHGADRGAVGVDAYLHAASPGV